MTQTKLAPHSDVSHYDLANAIRALSMDAVQAANSGHPGMPMGMADVATVLFSDVLKYDPRHPNWPDRDRFILSTGHGSMLLYSLLYLTGYADITLDEIKNFRQLHAKTCGHPEYGEAAGIETTTGPLGQGLANAVGMAMAEKALAAEFGDDVVDHYTYVLAGDGCLMEGISQEAISLAGHLKLSKLIILFDDNGISIDGPTSLTTSEDHVKRFEACGWHVQSINGHDPIAVQSALYEAKASDKPSMIACRTVIGYGSPNKQGTAGTHGSPLGDEEIAATRKELNWPHAPFEIPDAILNYWRQLGEQHQDAYREWNERLENSGKAEGFTQRISGELSDGWQQAILTLKQDIASKQPKDASRKSSQNVLDAIAPHMPELLGGSADLTGSNNTRAKGAEALSAETFGARYIHYGIREHSMAAAMNGIALHGGFVPFGGTFLVFTDYCRPAIRLSALMKQRVIYVMTHDSIGLGEDGPTHQPVEHLASLRAMPNLNVFRPADAAETAECWALALASNETPSILALSRQNLPSLRSEYTEENLCAYGAYTLCEHSEENPQVTLIGTGSEVSLCVEAAKALKVEGIAARVVSMPCQELFLQQPETYRNEVLGSGPAIAVEAASGFGWERFADAFIGMNGFGASAPAEKLYEYFGITAKAITDKARELVA